MTSVFESGQLGPASLYPGQVAGLRSVSDEQLVAFTQYTRYVLPLDGYVFWLKTATLQIQGSFHFAVDKRQEEDETIGVNRVVFSTGQDVQEFNAVAPDRMWVGDYQDLRFAFRSQRMKYRAADINHYFGQALYPAFSDILVETGDQLPLDTLIVSNSLPLWLTLAAYDPVWLLPANPGIALYPSFAVPENLPPPYGAVHVDPNGISNLEAVAAFPNRTDTQALLAQDRVRVTLYGLTNAEAWAWYNVVKQYSRDTDLLGISSMGPVVDEKRTQAELGVLALKKRVDFVVNYNQGAVRTAARQLIAQAVVDNFNAIQPAFQENLQ